MADPQNEPPEISEQHRRYWRTNLRLISILLSIWFVASYVLGILLVRPLNNIQIGGFKLGFWMAQQGAIYVFIVLILVYCLVMDREDKKFHVEETSGEASGSGRDSEVGGDSA